MSDSEQTSTSIGAASRARLPRAGWPIILASFDAVMIFAAVAANGATTSHVLLAIYAGMLVFMLVVGGVYSERSGVEVPGMVPFTILAITLAAMGIITLNFLFVGLPLTPSGAFALWAQTAGAVVAGRLITWPIHTAIHKAKAKRRTLIVGSGVAAVLLAEKIERHPELGLQTIGFVDDGPRKSVRGRREPLLGAVSELGELIESMDAQVVIFGYTHNATPDMLVALYQADPQVEVLMMPRYFEFVSTGMRVEGLAGMPVLRLNRTGLGRTERILKRAEDLVLAGIVTLLLLPFAPLIALAIKLDSPGPILFSHERVGRNGKPFRMYKFRSMTECAASDHETLARLAEEDPRGLKMKGDPRITKLGAFLRKSSIDELPQLLNVLKGDMSLVGPRPAVAAEVAAYDEWQKKRLTAAPGITGMWQVSGRSDVAFNERIWLDFMYIDSWSLWLDLSILARTVPAVLSARGAY